MGLGVNGSRSEPDRPRHPVSPPLYQPPSLGVIMNTRLAAASRRCTTAGAAPGNLSIDSNSGVTPNRDSGICRLAFAALALAVMVGCSSSTPNATGPGAAYQSATEFFARGHSANYDHALDTLSTLSDADPPNAYTDRARVLRAVILSGQFEGYRSLAEAYQKGSDSATDSAVRSEYASLARDTMRRAGEISLTFAETAMQLTKGGQVPKNLTLEAPYPVTLGSVSSATLDKVEKGVKIGEDEEQDAALRAPEMGIAKTLSAVVGGDQDAVKSKMNAGPVTLDRAAFALFLGNEVLNGASLFDKKHIYDPGKLKQLAGIADSMGSAAATVLKESPDPAAEKRLKTMQDQIKADLKPSSSS